MSSSNPISHRQNGTTSWRVKASTKPDAAQTAPARLWTLDPPSPTARPFITRNVLHITAPYAVTHDSLPYNLTLSLFPSHTFLR